MEGLLLCEGCAYSTLVAIPSRCYRCHKVTKQSLVCENCRKTAYLMRVWITTEYTDAAKELIAKLKFGRAKAASEVIASWIDGQLPMLDQDTIVTHIPTANSRIRFRGYDQAKLIAKSFARRRGIAYQELLQRRGSTRQVGANRKERLAQLEEAFVLSNSDVADQHILLVDDVLTTGATIEAAAKVIKKTKAKNVEAVVFAH